MTVQMYIFFLILPIKIKKKNKFNRIIFIIPFACYFAQNNLI